MDINVRNDNKGIQHSASNNFLLLLKHILQHYLGWNLGLEKLRDPNKAALIKSIQFFMGKSSNIFQVAQKTSVWKAQRGVLFRYIQTTSNYSFLSKVPMVLHWSFWNLFNSLPLTSRWAQTLWEAKSFQPLVSAFKSWSTHPLPGLKPHSCRWIQGSTDYQILLFLQHPG